MKKYYSLFLFWSLLTGLSTSCSDDNKKDPYLPTPPQVSIGNPSGQTTCLPGETIELKAILNNPLQTTFQWQLNKKTVSTAPFTPTWAIKRLGRSTKMPSAISLYFNLYSIFSTGFGSHAHSVYQDTCN